jgi:excisionase family DNA binding protein
MALLESSSGSSLLSVADVARRLRVSRHTIYRRVASGDLPAFRVGESGPLRFEASAVEQLLRPARAPR